MGKLGKKPKIETIGGQGEKVSIKKFNVRGGRKELESFEIILFESIQAGRAVKKPHEKYPTEGIGITCTVRSIESIDEAEKKYLLKSGMYIDYEVTFLE
jgi:hypothetical protein